MNKENDGTKSKIVDVSTNKKIKRKRIKVKKLVYSTCNSSESNK